MPHAACQCPGGQGFDRHTRERTRLTLVPHDDGPPVGLDPDEEAGVLKGPIVNPTKLISASQRKLRTQMNDPAKSW
jgi:hypothetical protein